MPKKKTDIKKDEMIRHPFVNANVRAKTINEDERSVEFVISDESVDRHGTVFKIDGWELDDYNRNPIVVYNHDWRSGDPDRIIGTGEVRVEGKKLIGKVFFERKEDNKLADKIWRKVKNGTLRMASVGFDPHEYRFGTKENGEDENVFYFTRQSLLEFSVTPLGSNKNALARNADILDPLKDKCRKTEDEEEILSDPYTARALLLNVKNRNQLL